jgi:hypothetical protein
MPAPEAKVTVVKKHILVVKSDQDISAALLLRCPSTMPSTRPPTAPRAPRRSATTPTTQSNST